MIERAFQINSRSRQSSLESEDLDISPDITSVISSTVPLISIGLSIVRATLSRK